MFISLNCFYTLDVISITGGSQTHLDPFTAANNVYVDTFGIRPGNFLKNTAPVPDPDDRSKVYHNMKITLLPHQIIIFPHAILGNLDIDDFAEGSPQYEMYNNEEIRYYINLYVYY